MRVDQVSLLGGLELLCSPGQVLWHLQQGAQGHSWQSPPADHFGCSPLANLIYPWTLVFLHGQHQLAPSHHHIIRQDDPHLLSKATTRNSCWKCLSWWRQENLAISSESRWNNLFLLIMITINAIIAWIRFFLHHNYFLVSREKYSTQHVSGLLLFTCDKA